VAITSGLCLEKKESPMDLRIVQKKTTIHRLKLTCGSVSKRTKKFIAVGWSIM